MERFEFESSHGWGGGGFRLVEQKTFLTRTPCRLKEEATTSLQGGHRRYTSTKQRVAACAHDICDPCCLTPTRARWRVGSARRAAAGADAKQGKRQDMSSTKDENGLLVLAYACAILLSSLGCAAVCVPNPGSEVGHPCGGGSSR